MSKAALYAGLGQGLMSLGQGVGKALELSAIERMREENMRKNWARQDAIRAEQMTYQKSRDAKQDALQQQKIEADKAWKEGTIEYRNKVLSGQESAQNFDKQKWSAETLISKVSAIDKSYNDQVKALRNGSGMMGAELDEALDKLKAETMQLKLSTIQGAPEESIKLAQMDTYQQYLAEQLAELNKPAEPAPTEEGKPSGLMDYLGDLAFNVMWKPQRSPNGGVPEFESTEQESYTSGESGMSGYGGLSAYVNQDRDSTLRGIPVGAAGSADGRDPSNSLLIARPTSNRDIAQSNFNRDYGTAAQTQKQGQYHPSQAAITKMREALRKAGDDAQLKSQIHAAFMEGYFEPAV